MPRVSEILYGVRTEGTQVKLAQIEGADLDVTAVGFFESEFAPGAVVVFTRDGEAGWFVTFSGVIIETLEKIKDVLPITARFMSHKSASGRTYWTIE